MIAGLLTELILPGAPPAQPFEIQKTYGTDR
jgi:hypothetical protein